MPKFRAVKAVKDYDGHWFVIPKDMADDFSAMLSKLIETEYSDYDLLDLFEEKFNKYRTGGDLNLIQLYVEVE